MLTSFKQIKASLMQNAEILMTGINNLSDLTADPNSLFHFKQTQKTWLSES